VPVLGVEKWKYGMHVSEVAVRESKKERFTVNERLAMLAEWEQCVDIGQKSALCRRLGIHPVTPRRWAQAKRDGLLEPSDSRQLNRMISKRELAELARLKRENEALKVKLAQSESAVEVLGKASELLAALAKSSHLHSPPTLQEQPAVPEASEVPEAFRAPRKGRSGSKPSPGSSGRG
jgi:transposase